MMTETFRIASNSHLSMFIVILLKTELKYISFLRVYVKHISLTRLKRVRTIQRLYSD